MTPDMLNRLIETIKNGWDTLYPILLKQVYIDGISNLIVAVVLSIILIISWLFVYKVYKNKLLVDKLEEQNDTCRRVYIKMFNFNLDDDDMETWLAISIIIAFVTTIFLLPLAAATIYQGTTRFINPDFYIIEFLIGNLK